MPSKIDQNIAIEVAKVHMEYRSESGDWTVSPSSLVDMLRDLGLLDFSERPKTATEKLIEVIGRINPVFQFVNSSNLCKMLHEAGIRVVETGSYGEKK